MRCVSDRRRWRHATHLIDAIRDGPGAVRVPRSVPREIPLMKRVFFIIVCVSVTGSIVIGLSELGDASIGATLRRDGWRITQRQVLYGGDFPGASVVQRLFAERDDSSIEVILTAYRIINRDQLKASLLQQGRTMTIGSRQGSVYPIAGSIPSSAFVMLGNTQAVTLEYGLRSFGNLMDITSQPFPNELVPLVERLVVK
jgi:hypothetical protein